MPRQRRDATTDTEGRFEFLELPPESFTIVAKPKPRDTKPNGDGVRIEPVPTYYPSATERAEAEPIALRGGLEQEGYDIRLRSVPVFRVRGTVFNEAGNPAKGVAVRLARRSAPSQVGGLMLTGQGSVTLSGSAGAGDPEEGRVTTGENGSFEFPAVREGEWLVRAESEWEWQGAPRRDVQRVGVTTAYVSRRDVEDLEIRLASNFEYTATLEWDPESARPPGNRLVGVMLRPTNGGAAAFGVDKSGGLIHFERVHPGTYYVAPAFGNASGSYVAAVYYGGRDVLGLPFDLTPTSPPMRIVMKSDAGAIRGTVENGQAAYVVLIPAANLHFDMVRSVEVRAGAAFQMTGLRPGDYYLAAFDRADNARLTDPAFLSRLTVSATRARVEERANVSVELRVNRWP